MLRAVNAKGVLASSRRYSATRSDARCSIDAPSVTRMLEHALSCRPLPPTPAASPSSAGATTSAAATSSPPSTTAGVAPSHQHRRHRISSVHRSLRPLVRLGSPLPALENAARYRSTIAPAAPAAVAVVATRHVHCLRAPSLRRADDANVATATTLQTPNR